MPRPNAKESISIEWSKYNTTCKLCGEEVRVEVAGGEHFRRELLTQDAHWRHCKVVRGLTKSS